jgi:hypothetical protein
MDKLYNEAFKLGASEFGESKNKNKRFYVIYQGKKINFGSKTGSTFIDHKDKTKRKAWHARHSKIKDKSGQLVINNPLSASYWSANLLW